MQTVPVVKCSDLSRSIRFYAEVLDFERKWPEYADSETANGVAHLVKAGAEMQLSRHAGDGVFGSLQRVFVDDVDERYRTFRARGLDTTQRTESPIHTAPVDQTWGLREFSVTDSDGNGLCFCAPITDRDGVASPSKATIVSAEPELFVTDVQRSCEFYREKLSFSLVFSYGNPPFYAQVGRDAVRLNLRFVEQTVIEPAARHREQLLSVTMTVATPDQIKMLFQEFKSVGVAFHQPLKKQSWGSNNFVVKDPDGNLLLFAGPSD